MFHRYPALRALSAYSVAVYGSQALTIARGILLARILGPAIFGIWSVVKLLLMYATQLNGGTLQAMRQELPRAIGARDLTRARQLVQVLTGLNVVVGIGIMAMCLIGALIGHWAWPNLPTWAWYFVAMLSIGELWCQFILVKLQSEEHVKRYSYMTLTYAVVAAVAMPVGALRGGVAGAFFGLVIAQAVCLIWAVATRELAAPGRLQWSAVRPLLAVGTPIWITWFPVILLGDIDQWLVARQLGTTALGLYGAATFLGGLLQFLPFIFRTIYQPFLMRRLGATRSWESIKPHVLDSLCLAAYASPIAIAVLFLLAEPLIVLALPAYQAGLPAAKSYALCCFWFIVAQTTYMVCIAARQEKRWLAHTLMAAAAHVLLTGYALRSGAGLVGATVCFGVIFFGYAALQLRLVVSLSGQGSLAWLRLLLKIALPFVASTLLLLNIDRWWVLPHSTAGLLAVSGLRTAAAVFVLSWMYRLANRRWNFAQVLAVTTGQRLETLRTSYDSDPVSVVS